MSIEEIAKQILEIVRDSDPSPNHLSESLHTLIHEKNLDPREVDQAMWKLAKDGRITLDARSRVVVSDEERVLTR